MQMYRFFIVCIGFAIIKQELGLITFFLININLVSYSPVQASSPISMVPPPMD